MVVVDQLKRSIDLAEYPVRIVSLVPSQSEFLYDLGLMNRMAGITRYCIHPDVMFRNLPHVGGTKKPDLAKIRALAPDLVIGNKEENGRETIELLMNEYPVWMSDVRNLNHAFEMMECLGSLTGNLPDARKITESINRSFQLLQNRLNASGGMKRTAAYLIWNNPLMTINKDTFIHDMMQRAGFRNIFGEENQRYPVISKEQLQEKNPDILLLSSEPFPFGKKHEEEMKRLLPKTNIQLVEGEAFSWYGSRLKFSASYLLSFVKHPDT